MLYLSIANIRIFPLFIGYFALINVNREHSGRSYTYR